MLVRYVLSNMMLSKLPKRQQLKPISRRVDYDYFNYCSTRELKYPKEILRCKDYNQKIKVKPWHHSKILDSKRI